ncbi:cysteine-rich CWC family protein [Bradyrhizobium sp. 2TAF24]|uniref:cysteine-rich CWC family protein n=1 Tax=Bradyrhizobium sp. 2TAF24 TaxID=3233011 RepID=UPI003F928D81
MTERSARPATETPARRLTCARCGTAFGCDLSSECWCHAETARLPMPTSGGDCLCPACLRAAAAVARSGAGA